MPSNVSGHDTRPARRVTSLDTPTSAFTAGNFRKPCTGIWVESRVTMKKVTGGGSSNRCGVDFYYAHKAHYLWQMRSPHCTSPAAQHLLDACPPRLVDVCPGNANSFQCILFDGLEGIWDYAEPQGHGYEQQLLCWRFTDVLVTRGLWLIERWTTKRLLSNGGGKLPNSKIHNFRKSGDLEENTQSWVFPL